MLADYAMSVARESSLASGKPSLHLDIGELEMALQLVSQAKAYGGVLKRFSHESAATKTPMRFSVFLPPSASDAHRVPALVFLAGLTCDDERVFMKAPGVMKVAAERGIAVVSPDTRCARLGVRWARMARD